MPVPKAQGEDGRDFVDGLDFDPHAPDVAGQCAHRRVGEERLEAQDALRFRAQPLSARLSDG
jgi:hypothetical protein